MPVNANLSFDLTSLVPTTTNTSGTQATKGTQTQQRQLSAEATQSIIDTILKSDNGLASLASGENAAGLSGTTAKTQLTQDLVAAISGQIAQITAPLVTTTDSETTSSQSAKKRPTVICTELWKQGKLDSELYADAAKHSEQISRTVYLGYIYWAPRVVDKMQKSERLSNFLAPVVTARYQYLTGRKFSFVGALTVWIGHPVCYILGKLISGKESVNAYSNT